jgi:glycosyltransferase involved in cell wall biosynthesis
MNNVWVMSVIPGLARRRGGPSFGVAGLCEAVAHTGITQLLMTVAAPSGEPEVIPLHDDVETIRLTGFHSQALRLTYSPGFYRKIIGQSRSRNISIIHNHGLWTQPNHVAARVARQLEIPLVVSTHGMVAAWALQHKAWKKRLGWWAYQRADLEQACVIRATAEHEVLAIRRLGFRQPIALIPNGIEIPDRAEPANGKDPRVLLFVGRIYPVKGLLNLVKAWAAVRPQGWRCVIAGPDEAGHKREVEAAIGDAGLGSAFSFPGAIDGNAKWDLYRSADLLVLPSFTENFGLVVPEALACGVPVITTKGTPWKSLQAWDCGWWVDVGVEPLAAALKEATGATDARRREMGLRGRQLVEERYDWGPLGKSMAAVYQWILGRAPKPECVC